MKKLAGIGILCLIVLMTLAGCGGGNGGGGNEESPSSPSSPSFSDNFERNELGANWTVVVDVNPSGAKWEIVQDASISSKVLTTGSWGSVIAGDATWANYFVSAKVKPEISSTIGLIACFQDRDNYYSAVLDGQKLILKKKYGGSATVLGSSDFSYSTSQYYQIKLQVNGSALAAYAGDGTDPLITYTDNNNPFSSGKIGLTCSTPSTGFFDDVLVTKL